MTAVI